MHRTNPLILPMTPKGIAMIATSTRPSRSAQATTVVRINLTTPKGEVPLERLHVSDN